MSELARLLMSGGVQPPQQAVQPVQSEVHGGSGPFSLAEALERMGAGAEPSPVVAAHEASEPQAVETAEDATERGVPHHAQFQPRDAGRFAGPPDRDALDAAIRAAMDKQE